MNSIRDVQLQPWTPEPHFPTSGKYRDPVAQLCAAGVSLWLDDLSRGSLQTGSLKRTIETEHIVGINTSPETFRTALEHEVVYQQQIRQLAAQGADVDTIVRVITTDDVRDATDLFSGVYSRTRGADGRVSIAVDPRLADDPTSTIEQAQELFKVIRRNNILIDIPATLPGLSAITEATARGQSVNATLVFSLERYSAVMEAYLAGLEQARSRDHDLSQIRSVASFSISFVHTEIDRRLQAIDSPAALKLLGQAGGAYAALVYQAYEQTFAGDRWGPLMAAGAHPQRPLWISRTNQDPRASDISYLTDLVAPGTVHTTSRETIEALAHHGPLHRNLIMDCYSSAAEVFGDLDTVGIDLGDVFSVLETDGVSRRQSAWVELLDSVRRQIANRDPSIADARHTRRTSGPSAVYR